MPYPGASGAGRAVHDGDDWNEQGYSEPRHRLRAHARPAATYPVSVAEVRRLRHEQAVAEEPAPAPVAARRRPITGGRRVSGPVAGREHDHLLVRDRAFDDDTEVRERRRQRRNRGGAPSWDDPWAVGAQRSSEPWAVAGEWWDEPRQAAADAARREGDEQLFDYAEERAFATGPHPVAEPVARRARADRDAGTERRSRRRNVDLRAAWRQLYLVDSDDPSVIEHAGPRGDAPRHDDGAYDGGDYGTPMYDGAVVAVAEARARTAERAEPAPARDLVPAPVDTWAEEQSELEAAGGRRTVTITGRGDDRQWSPTAPVQRPNRRAIDRIGYKPERAAMWAVLLGLVLVLVAATSSHAAVLHAHHVVAHLLAHGH